MNEVVISARATRDLTEAYAFIGQDNPQAADRVLDRLVGVFRLLAAGELIGPEVILRTGHRARRWSVPPYRVYYRRTATRTFIVRVYH